MNRRGRLVGVAQTLQGRNAEDGSTIQVNGASEGKSQPGKIHHHQHCRQLREETTARAPDPETLNRWIEEGRQ